MTITLRRKAMSHVSVKVTLGQSYQANNRILVKIAIKINMIALLRIMKVLSSHLLRKCLDA
jgi:hypothetical protein